MAAVLILLDFLLAPLGAADYRTRADAHRRLERLPAVALAPLAARGICDPDDEVRHRCRLLAGRLPSLDPVRVLLYGGGRIDAVPDPLDPAWCVAVNREWFRLGVEALETPASDPKRCRDWVLEWRANLRGKTAGHVPFRCFPRHLPYHVPADQ